MAEQASEQQDEARSKQEQRTRQRFARRQWARRWGALRYVVALLVAVLLALTGAWFVLFSDYLSVQHVKVQGADILTDRQVSDAAKVPVGEQLATVDLARVRSRVAALAEVKSVDVTREWPDTVRITVVERTAVAVVKIAGTWRGLDALGVPFREYPRPPGDLPRVHASSNAQGDALAEAALVVASMPAELAAKVDHVEVETIDRISLALRSGRSVQWGSSEESELKAEVLLKLLAAHKADSYDVSVPGNPTAG
ncbi:MAG: cell division protein FtsQ/DivIB [Nocardioides sp.]|uniref:cell division protein FtsQ/DivIB n=1 Tax=Nocardioides sp. TaxID=35761 RepID=UPI003EFE369A